MLSNSKTERPSEGGLFRFANLSNSNLTDTLCREVVNMSSAESGIETTPLTYRIDAKRSRFTVRAFAGGMLSALGHNPTIAIRDFEGVIQFLPERLDLAQLRISIKADSLTVTDDVSEKDRLDIESKMREEVLETDKYPQIIFESTSVSGEKIFAGQYRVTINGKLSLHGVTRDCAVAGQVIASDDSLRANGEFTLLQTDYRIRLVSAAGGTIKLKDELKFSFDIVARKESA
jgi:polyisoprenoid-binding protein YceI